MKYGLSLVVVTLACGSGGGSNNAEGADDVAGGVSDVPGADGADAADSAADASDAQTSDAPSATEGCPLVGEFELESFVCGTEDITADFLKAVGSSRMTLLGDATGCHAVVTNASPTCSESAELTGVRATGNDWATTSQGISKCEPEGCTFGPKDAPCKLGDRAGVYTETLLFDGPDRMTGTRTDGQTLCSSYGLSPTVVTWRRRAD